MWLVGLSQRSDFRRPLLTMADIKVGASVCLLVANAGVRWFVWLAAVLTAVGSSSWNSIGMLSIIVIAGPSGAGRASGIVMFGFLVGFGAGPPLFGRLVDSTGSYTSVWWIAAVASLGAVALMAAWSPHTASRRAVALQR
jgi:cyanate permease